MGIELRCSERAANGLNYLSNWFYTLIGIVYNTKIFKKYFQGRATLYKPGCQELTILTVLALNSEKSACLCLPSDGIKGMSRPAQPKVFNSNDTSLVSSFALFDNWLGKYLFCFFCLLDFTIKLFYYHYFMYISVLPAYMHVYRVLSWCFWKPEEVLLKCL